jgi:hypothetical protein
VVTHRPPPAPPPSFERQAAAIAAKGGQPLDGAQLRSLRSPPPVRALAPTVAPLAPGATVYRGIPERSPQFQAAPQPATTNVFQQRDRELQQQRELQQREQQAQETQIQQRLKQDRIQQQQLRRETQPQAATAQPVSPPQVTQPQAAPSQVAPPPRPRTDIRRGPEPIPPAQAR